MYLLCKILIAAGLFTGFTILFYIIRKNRVLQRTVKEAYDSIDLASTQRARERKRELVLHGREKGVLYRIEKELVYSGLPRRYPFLAAEVWILILAATGAAVYGLSTLLAGWKVGVAGAALAVLLLVGMEKMLAWKNYRQTDRELLELVNLLGNYSITAGEMTSVFPKVSSFVGEPLRSVLEECYYEAQTSGDARQALLSMADKLEHPYFKLLIKNMEVCSRYTTDYSTLITNCRRELQAENMAKQERKSLVEEAVVHMVILLVMLTVALLATDSLITMSIWDILFQTLVGRAAMLIVAVILVLLSWKIITVER